MSSLRFRAWNHYNATMTYSHSFNELSDFFAYCESLISHSDADSSMVEMMQYTCLKDSRRTKKYPEGKRLYMGDIVASESGIGVIAYNLDDARWIIIGEKKDYPLSSKVRSYGNIHEDEYLPVKYRDSYNLVCAKIDKEAIEYARELKQKGGTK